MGAFLRRRLAGAHQMLQSVSLHGQKRDGIHRAPSMHTAANEGQIYNQRRAERSWATMGSVEACSGQCWATMGSDGSG